MGSLGYQDSSWIIPVNHFRHNLQWKLWDFPLQSSEFVLLNLLKAKLTLWDSYYNFISFLSTVLNNEIEIFLIVLKTKHNMEFCLYL